MDPKQARNEKNAIILVGLILGAIAYILGHAWGGALSKLLPIPVFFCMGPLLKTIFFATIQRDLIPQGSKLLILSSFAMTIAGLFISMLGPLFRNPFLGILICSLGIMITLFGFMPLQRVAQVPKQETEQ
ncbi:MAG: hypothetical protein WCI55_05490 [Armatimonadota bacterium]